jgi:hypothetical protein
MLLMPEAQLAALKDHRRLAIFRDLGAGWKGLSCGVKRPTPTTNQNVSGKGSKFLQRIKSGGRRRVDLGATGIYYRALVGPFACGIAIAQRRHRASGASR